MENILNEATEEKNMLLEDLNGHISQKAEYTEKLEELEVMHKQLTESTSCEFSLYIKSLNDKTMSNYAHL